MEGNKRWFSEKRLLRELFLGVDGCFCEKGSEEDAVLLAAMFRSESVILSKCCSSWPASTSMSASSNGADASTERGCLPAPCRRGLGGGGIATGDGDNDGSFSLVSSSTESSVSENMSASGCSVDADVVSFILTADAVGEAGREASFVCAFAIRAIISGSSPRCFASSTASAMSCGIGAWIDVINLARRANSL